MDQIKATLPFGSIRTRTRFTKGAGIYPLEGGYININVINYQTHVFKFPCTNGVPLFTKVADFLV